MGRVNNHAPTPAAAATTTPLTHFSHPHELHPVSIHTASQAVCSGCRLHLPANTAAYACVPCNFTLHQSCAKLPRRITHPAHGGCTLSLLTSPSYSGGVFSCDACCRRGDGWSYHCAQCEYDLHVTCACKQLKIRHGAHARCELHLTFKNPYANTSGFSCDICRRVGSKQWLYRCNSCEFDAHLDCVAAAPPQQLLQHHHSLPAAAATPLYNNHQLVHSASTGGMNLHGQYTGPQPQMMGAQFQNPIVNSGQGYGTGVGGGGLGGHLVMAAVQGFVEGAFQEVGQTLVQEAIGGGDAGGDGGGGGDASAA